MRDTISWLNDEITQAWPILLVIAPAGLVWARKRWHRFRADVMKLLSDSINESASKAAGAHAADIGVIREQVANDHKSNLREDLDALHEDLRLLTGLVEQHLEWSQEWSSTRDQRIDSLEAAHAAPRPPAT